MSIGLIGEQHVSKRWKPSSLDTFKYTKPAHTAGFHRDARQHPNRRSASKPAHETSPEKTRESASTAEPGKTGSLRRFIDNFFGNGTAPAGGTRRTPKRQGAGFSIPLPSIGKASVVAGILVILLIALNWEGLPRSVSVSRRFLLEPAVDMGEVERKLSAYANNLFSPALPGLETPDAASSEIPLNELPRTLEWTSYRVKKGDTVSGIAQRFSISKDAVIAANNIQNVRRLGANAVLKIPNIDGIPYTVKKGDSLAGISQTMNVSVNVLLDTNNLPSTEIKPNDMLFIPGARLTPEAMKLALGELMVYPVQGRLTDGYGLRNDPISGERRFHAALDLAAATGTRVQSVMDGKVATLGFNLVFGNYVIVNHSGGYQSMYAHLNTITVKKGARVKQAEKIGEVGETGYTTGPHLHFVLYKNGRPQNPLDLLHR